MIGIAWRLGAQLGDDALERLDAPTLEFGGRQHARPGVEYLHRLGAGLYLAQEVGGGSLDEPIDQRREQFWLAIGEEPRRRLVGRAAASDHVARHRPGSAAEADQGGFRRQALASARDRFENRRQPRPVRRLAQRREIGRSFDRLQARTLAALEADALTERVGNDENVGEQDRRVEAEAANRLQRRLRREGGRIAEVEERGRLRTDLAIFGQVTSGLAHQPDRRRLLPRPVQGGEKALRLDRGRDRHGNQSVGRSRAFRRGRDPRIANGGVGARAAGRG